MTRSHALTAALTLLAASTATAQHTPRVIGPGVSGAQPQVGTGPYQGATPAALGVNPFAAPVLLPPTLPGTRFAPRTGGAPAVFAQPPARGVPINPALFNPGVPPPFPVLIPPPVPVVNGLAYNPLFVSRRGVVSAYYVPPIAVRSPGFTAYPGEEAFTPAAADAGPGLVPPPGEYRFLPWIW
jgi:hypothetical protein